MVLVLCWLGCVHARVETLDHKVLEEGDSLSNKIVFITAADSLIGSDAPTFEVDQTFSLATKPASWEDLSTVSIIFYPVLDSMRVGIVDEDSALQLCCTASLVERKVCEEEGSVLIFPGEEDKVDTIVHKEFEFFEEGETTWRDSWKVNRSGVYELLYVNCGGSGLGKVLIDGTLTYTNPFGQLSAETYPLLWFFGIAAAFVVVLFTAWGITNLIHRSTLISLQHFLSALLVLMLVESITWFLMFWVINLSGRVHWGWVTITVLTSSIKRTAVGLLYLLISLGYGIMNKARITNNVRLIVLVISFYFLVSTSQELITAYIREGVVAAEYEVLLGFISLVMLFPAVMIPLGLFWWICACLIKTIQKLKLRKQEAKLELYNKILVSLIVAAVVTAMMIIMETGISLVDSDQLWRVWWIFSAYWFVLFLCLTLSLLKLLHPKRNETWLAYTRKESIDDEDSVQVELDTLESDLNVNFDFDLGFDDINVEEETSKIS